MVDRLKGMPARCAAMAPAHSPSVCIMRVKPVGAMASGMADSVPQRVVRRLTFSTSRRTPGRKARLSNTSEPCVAGG